MIQIYFVHNYFCVCMSIYPYITETQNKFCQNSDSDHVNEDYTNILAFLSYKMINSNSYCDIIRKKKQIMEIAISDIIA